MKINKTIIYSAICAVLALTSCKDSFLDQTPPLYSTESDAYDSPKRIEMVLRSLYADFKNTSRKSFMGGKTYLIFDNRGDDLVNKSNNLVYLFDAYNMRVMDSSGENIETWTYAYQTINKVNVFLEELEKAKDIVPENFEQYKAEAKFVRAISYYYLNNLYALPYVINPDAQSVPLRLKAEKLQGNNSLAPSSVKEVYAQILLDLEGMSALPTKNNSVETVTRATQAAANMLKMRVYMSMNEWDKALEAGKAVTGYELTADPKAPFSTPFVTKENIFSLPMNLTNRPNTQQSLAESYYNGQVLSLDAANGITSKENYSLKSDKRVVAFFGAKDMYLKFSDAKDKLEWVPIFRYAETLLNMAECYINLNNAEEAKACLKQVRARSINPSEDPLNIDALSNADLKEAIYNEKRLEMLAEGIRSIDITRRGETFVKGKIKVSPTDDGYIFPYPLDEKLTNNAI